MGSRQRPKTTFCWLPPEREPPRVCGEGEHAHLIEPRQQGQDKVALDRMVEHQALQVPILWHEANAERDGGARIGDRHDITGETDLAARERI